ncbi:DUF397 domain-containing protein [Streptomyces bacillaris]|uniref:DUF397 domain-containing protein n=1 Tax=Streptomyces bacillaris TaxID=68179 RepID=UPI0037F8F5FB
MIAVSDGTAPAITPFDRTERRIRSGRAEAYADTSAPEWFKSSRSSDDGPERAEVAAVRGTVPVRDSKDLARPPLDFTAAWSDFLPYAPAGEAPASVAETRKP